MIEAKEEPLPHSAFDYSDRVNETARMITEKKRKDGAWICVCVKATDGSRYGFNYLGTTGSPYNSGNAAYFPLGGTAQDFTNGEWVRLERDLQADLTNRFGKTLSSITGIYLWSGGATTPKLWIDDVSFSNSLTVEHNTLGGGSIGHILRHTETNSSSYAQSHRWFHYDQVGSVMAESDASGALAQTHYQDAFGNTQASWSTGLWGGDKDGWHHNTKEYDIAIGMTYMASRWYISEIGSFNNSAVVPPFAEARFSFTNSPVDTIDPLGTFPLVMPIDIIPPMPMFNVPSLGGSYCGKQNPYDTAHHSHEHIAWEIGYHSDIAPGSGIAVYAALWLGGRAWETSQGFMAMMQGDDFFDLENNHNAPKGGGSGLGTPRHRSGWQHGDLKANDAGFARGVQDAKDQSDCEKNRRGGGLSRIARPSPEMI